MHGVSLVRSEGESSDSLIGYCTLGIVVYLHQRPRVPDYSVYPHSRCDQACHPSFILEVSHIWPYCCPVLFSARLIPGKQFSFLRLKPFDHLFTRHFCCSLGHSKIDLILSLLFRYFFCFPKSACASSCIFASISDVAQGIQPKKSEANSPQAR